MITGPSFSNIGWRTYIGTFSIWRNLSYCANRSISIAALNALIVPVVYFFFPETAGRSLEGAHSPSSLPHSHLTRSLCRYGCRLRARLQRRRLPSRRLHAQRPALGRHVRGGRNPWGHHAPQTAKHREGGNIRRSQGVALAKQHLYFLRRPRPRKLYPSHASSPFCFLAINNNRTSRHTVIVLTASVRDWRLSGSSKLTLCGPHAHRNV